MKTIEAANEIIKQGLALLPDEMKGDFKAQASDIFIDEAIVNATGALLEVAKSVGVDNDKLYSERVALLRAYAVQEANRMVSTLWREELLTPELEKKYRDMRS